MSQQKTSPAYELYYWPLPFRGCFVSYLFAYSDVSLLEISEFEAIEELMSRPPEAQEIPFMGPPVLRNRASGQTLSQMPAIVMHVSGELGLMPETPFDVAMSLKLLMDCNDILMEICRYNGSLMWEREAWIEFRTARLPRWLAILEASLQRGHLGGDPVTFADIGVFALLGNMTRCLPQLDGDVLQHAPGIHALCERIGAKPSLADFVAVQEAAYGNAYCGGQIEQSIRRMLAMDAS